MAGLIGSGNAKGVLLFTGLTISATFSGTGAGFNNLGPAPNRNLSGVTGNCLAGGKTSGVTSGTNAGLLANLAPAAPISAKVAPSPRSEERRVGKECRSRWSQ